MRITLDVPEDDDLARPDVMRRVLLEPGKELQVQGFRARVVAGPDEIVAASGLVRDILESLCILYGLGLESVADPGNPARNYELADRLGIGAVFGLKEGR